MIRKLNEADIDKVMDIWMKSTIKAHDFISKEYWQNNYNTVKEVYIPMSETFVYKDVQGIKGFISVINNECIGALFVDIDFQGNGIGKQLIDYAVSKYGKLQLAVYKENKKSGSWSMSRNEWAQKGCGAVPGLLYKRRVYYYQS